MEAFKKVAQHSVLNNNSGFTLIEVLVAIIILAFISLYSYQMIDENTETKDRIITEDRNLMQTLTALNRIEIDFNELYSPLFSYPKAKIQTSSDPYQDTNTSFNSSFEGKTQNGMQIPQIVSEDKSTILFLSKVNRRKVAETKESNFVWIKYSLVATKVDKDEGDEEYQKAGGFDLVRQTISADPFATNLNWSDVRHQIILSNIKTLEFSFYDTQNKKYTTTLSDLNENKNAIRSLKINFTWVNRDKNEFKFEKVFRVLHPYFNTKLDEMKTGTGAGGWQDPPPPVPGSPTPSNGGELPDEGIQ